MEQGMIHDMKLHYRHQILTELVSKNLSIADFYKNLSVKDGVRLIAQAWDQISIENIQKCFSKIFPTYIDVTVPAIADTPTIESFMDLISKIPECVENKYNYERLKFWLACDEAEPIRDRNVLSLYSFKDELKIEDENLDIYDNYEEEVPHAIEIITESNLKNSSVLNEEMIHDDTEMDILSNPPQEVFEQMKQSDDDFIYEENLSNVVTCDQAIDAMEVVLNFMKNDSESRYRDVVFLTELKKKLKRRFETLDDNGKN